MTYIRTDTPDFSVPLSREELRVFTSIRGETSFDELVTKTRFDSQLLENVVANLVARGLIRLAGRDAPARVQAVTPPQTAPRWHEQRRAVEAFLLSRVGGSKAETYIAQLRDCTSEEAFIQSTRALAKRLSLIVDASVGEALLAVLDS